MSVIDRDLVRAINSGRCFALIGSGPSCELGVPSWQSLAEVAIREIVASEDDENIRVCRDLLSKKRYPEVFSLTEKIIGRERLLAIIKRSLAGSKQTGILYQYVASWPFACYLTTNFDDYLKQHLETLKVPVVVRQNSQDDMRVLHSTSINLIMKIHGDFSVPQDIVLTAEQYFAFRAAEGRLYWRDTILSALKMTDLVILGYSTEDPDFRDQLERAKKIAAPNHPVFLFATGMDQDEVKNYYQRYNIRVITYNNEDGTHHDLHRVLKRYNPFIAKRKSYALGLKPIDESISSLASSMYLFTELRLADTKDACIQKVYASVILQILSRLPDNLRNDIPTLRKTLAEKTFSATVVDPSALQAALESLHSLGFIDLTGEPLTIAITSRGKEAIAKIRVERILIQEKFDQACCLYLKNEYANIQESAAKTVIEALRAGLVRAFEKRGMEIGRSIFSDDIVDISDATDILEVINKESSILSNVEQRSAFADLLIEVLLRPGEDTKSYLAALAQGYFAYHALGLEPRCSQERLEIAKEKKWILDSSILLPILV